jgi:hypothetical protein
MQPGPAQYPESATHNDVVDDLIEHFEESFPPGYADADSPKGLFGRDLAVWQDGRLMAVVRRGFDGQPVATMYDDKTAGDTTGSGAKMQAAIERLRRSKEESDAENRRVGWESGQRWAMEDAEFVQLKELADFRDRRGQEWDSFFVPTEYSDCRPDEMIFFALYPDREGERLEKGDFSHAVTGDGYLDLTDMSILRGFVEGALAFWDEVKDQL